MKISIFLHSVMVGVFAVGLVEIQATVAHAASAADSTVDPPESQQRVANAADTLSTSALEEIVVTAQKRSENVQRVPIAITAFTATALQEHAVDSVASLSNITPNVTLDAGSPFSGSSSVLSAYIRGIGQDDFAANLDPGVGVYLDGVYLARTVGANLDLPDVERIEILKGPQGTLFGRNTIGGAISVVTRDPGKEFSFRGDATTGRYNRLDVNGSVDMPITGTLLTSLTFSSRRRDGYLKRIPFPDTGQYDNDQDAAFRSNGTTSSATEGGQDEWTLRGKVKWEPTDRIQIRIAGDYLNQDQSATANSVLGITSNLAGPFAVTPDQAIITPFGPTALYNAASGIPPDGFNLAGLYNFCINSTPVQIAARNAGALCGPRGTPLDPRQQIGGIASVNVDGNPYNNRLPYDSRFLSPNIDSSYATGISFAKLTNWGASANMDFDLAEWAKLKSITGYRRINWATGLDADGSPVRALEFSFSLQQTQFSQEFQLTGDVINHKLKYVLGAYYFSETNFLSDYVTFDQGLLQIYGPNHLKTTNDAFFGQLDYEITPLISVTVGGRYTHEDKSINGGQTDLNGFNYKLFNCPVYGDPCSTALGFPNAAQPLRYYVSATQYKKFSNFSPKFGLQLHPSDNILAYGSMAKGYKTGGWTTRLSNPLLFAPDFNEEKAVTYELGLKSQLFDRHMQINAAAFTTQFKDIQLNFQEGVSPTIQNAGNARIKGFELETVAVAAPGLTISTSVGYIDDYYTSVLPNAQVAPNPYQAGVYPGAPLPKTPRWKVNISPRYEEHLGSGAQLVYLVDLTRTTQIWNDAERTYLLERPASNSLNASVTYKDSSGHWETTVGGTNLTNDRYLTSGGNQTTAGVIFGTYNRPVEWYGRVGVKF